MRFDEQGVGYETDPEKFVQIVKALEPTFGGINLEDIKSPECFYIEQELKKQCNIPVMHDDQHGTAIISAAALLNALEIQKKKIDRVKFVVNGAGAAAIACIKLYESLGAKPSNFMVFDRKGILYEGRVALPLAGRHPPRGPRSAAGTERSASQCGVRRRDGSQRLTQRVAQDI